MSSEPTPEELAKIEEKKAKRRAYYLANREIIKAKSKAWKEANAERAQEAVRQWHMANPDARQKHRAAWAKANPEKVREGERGWRSKNRDKLRSQCKARREANPEKSREKCRAWRQANPERSRELSREYSRARYAKDPTRYNASTAAWKAANRPKVKAALKARVASNPATRIAYLLRARLKQALKTGRGNKSGNCLTLVGCSWTDLRSYIEGQFEPGMTWENNGSVWHVDHIIPCAKFDLTRPEEQKACFHFSNFRPLCATRNRSEGDRKGTPQQATIFHLLEGLAIPSKGVVRSEQVKWDLVQPEKIAQPLSGFGKSLQPRCLSSALGSLPGLA